MTIASGIAVGLSILYILILGSRNIVFAVILLGVFASAIPGADLPFRALALLSLVFFVLRFPRLEFAGVERVSAMINRFAVAITIALAIPVILHGEWELVPNIFLGTLTLVLIGSAALRVYARPAALTMVSVLFVLVVASVIMARVAPGMAFGGERLRGVFTNANTLGFMASMLIGVTLMTVRSRTAIVGSSALAAYALYMTDSRTSIITAGVLVIAAAFKGTRQAKQVSWAILGVAAVGALLTGQLAQMVLEPFMNRGGLSSRAGSLLETGRAFEDSPWTGVGFDGLREEVAGSPLRALAVGGIVMVALVGVALLFLLRDAAQMGSRLAVLVVAGIVHSIGEGWLISTTGPLILSFVVILGIMGTMVSGLDGPNSSKEGEVIEVHLLATDAN